MDGLCQSKPENHLKFSKCHTHSIEVQFNDQSSRNDACRHPSAPAAFSRTPVNQISHTPNLIIQVNESWKKKKKEELPYSELL